MEDRVEKTSLYVVSKIVWKRETLVYSFACPVFGFDTLVREALIEKVG